MRTLTLLLSLLAAVAASNNLMAQDKPVDTSFLKDYSQTRGFMLGRPVRPRVTPDGRGVLFLRARPRVAKMSLYELDVATGKTRELLTPEAVLKGAEEHLTPEEKARRERQRVTVGGFANYHLSPDGKNVLVSLSGRLYLVPRDTGKAVELKTSQGTLVDPKFSPDGKLVSYVLDHDVYVIDPAGQKETRVTTGGTERKSHGLAEFVAQEEMGRFTGYWWSPDSKFLAFQENDAEGVEVWYVADPISPGQSPHPSYYPRPGKKNVGVRLGIVPVTGGAKPKWLEWNRKTFPYLANVHWQKGGLTVAVQTRLQQELTLAKLNPITGKLETLLTERDPAWLNLNHDKPHWLGDGSFLWHGEGRRDARLEHRDKSGKLLKVLPTGPGFLGIVHVRAKEREVIYRASANPTEEHLFRLSLDSDKPEALTKAPGLHSAVFGKSGDVYVHTASLLNEMPHSAVYKDGKKVADLPSVAESPPFKVNQTIQYVAGLWTTVVRPRQFQRRTRYPVIVHVYGGPGHREVQAQMTRRLIDQWLADQGFVVVAIDNRGTPGRGRDFERAVYKRFGDVPLGDQVKGLKALGAKFPEMDLARVGTYGWSFGGYMAAQAVLRRPDVFQAAVAGAPVTDWEDYDTHYTERYLGLPQQAKKAYKEGSLLTYAKDLKRPLLLVHGTADDNVYFRHTLKLADALFREGKDFDVLPLSGLTHLLPDPVVMQRLYGRFATFFLRHLGRPAEVKGAGR